MKLACWVGGGSPALMRWHPWAEGRFAQVGLLVGVSALTNAILIGSWLVILLGAPLSLAITCGGTMGVLSSAFHRCTGQILAARRPALSPIAFVLSTTSAGLAVSPLVIWLWAAAHEAPLALSGGLILFLTLMLLQLGPVWANILLRSDTTMRDYQNARKLVAILESFRHENQDDEA